MSAERDPGLPSERTALAWQRTALGVVLGSAVLALAALREGDPVIALVATALGAASAAGAVASRLGRWPAPEARPWLLLASGAGVVLVLAVLGLAAALARTLR